MITETIVAIVISAMLLVLIYLVPSYFAMRNKKRYWKAKYWQQNKAFTEKEKRIVQLKGEVKALAWMTNMIQDLEAMDEMVCMMEQEQSPDSYRKVLSAKLGEIKNLKQVLELSEQSNELLVNKFNELQKEYNAIAGMINKAVDDEDKPEAMLSGVVRAEQASPAEQGQLVMGGR